MPVMTGPETRASAQVLKEISRKIELAGTEEKRGSLGPPCSAFFLKHYRCRGEILQLIAIWRVTRAGAEEVSLEEEDNLRPGATRGSLFENAIVVLQTDGGRHCALVNWVYGPLYARYLEHSMQEDGSLDDGTLRGIS